MPGLNGTGPDGQGAATGRGLGNCKSDNAQGCGRRRGRFATEASEGGRGRGLRNRLGNLMGRGRGQGRGQNQSQERTQS